MREIRYVLADPTGNLTCLVLDPVPAEERPAVTAALMDRCEQVGYLTAPRDPRAVLRLEMMGGEFCGNAAMSAAAYWAEKMDLGEDGEGTKLLLEVSGAEGLISCEVGLDEDGDWHGEVDMPIPTRMEQVETEGKVLDAVFLPGIVHLVCPDDDLTDGEAESILEAAKDLFPDQPAIGLLQYVEEEETMVPLVWVRESDTQVWETACGSGTVAVAYRQALLRSGSATVGLYQPGGVLVAEIAREDDRIVRAVLSGLVRLNPTQILRW